MIEQLAAALRIAAEQRVPCAPLRDRLSGIAEAYAVQDANTRFWLSRGRRLVGRKIGLTAKAVQKQLGVDQPDYGMLYADMCIGDGEDIPPGAVLQPRAEAEVALVLRDGLDDDALTIADLIRAAAYCLPAIEIVGSRIAAWDIKLVDTIADNASSGLFVLGTRPVPLSGLDLAECAMQMTKNGTPCSDGSGVACMGNPLNAALWLARTMVKVKRPLQPGDVVMTGALGPMVAVASGDSLLVEISGLGKVRTALL